MWRIGSRVIEHELLDDQPPGYGDASLGDLVRINARLGGHGILQRTISRLYPETEPFYALDVGAASGDAARVIRLVNPQATVVSLDYRSHHLRLADQPKLVADAFHLPFHRGEFDLVHCSLFLHHFGNQQIVQLLQEFGRISRRYVVASDLERHPLAFWFLPATKWLFGWHPITLHDGPISVRAGFKFNELAALARSSGLRNISIKRYRPAFRLCLVAEVPTRVS
jgi:SAM-dependent methyltransferase